MAAVDGVGEVAGERSALKEEVVCAIREAVAGAYEAMGETDGDTFVVTGKMGRSGVFLRIPQELVDEWKLDGILEEAQELLDRRLDEQFTAWAARLAERRRAAGSGAAAD